jgi:NADPH:quinone reductase-like Zn-dependent oxidoreductase
VRDNGVTYPLNHDTYDKELLKQSPVGVDIIIDNLAGSAFSRNQCLLKPLGRIVLIGREMDPMRHKHGEGYLLLVGKGGGLDSYGLLLREKWRGMSIYLKLNIGEL